MIDKFLSSKWTKLWFAVSAAAFVGLNLSRGNIIGMISNIPVAFAITLFLEHRYKILGKLFEVRSKKYVWISIPIAVYIATEIVLCFHNVRIARLFASTENTFALKIQELIPEQFLRIGLYSVSVVAGIVAFFVLFAVVYVVISHFNKRVATKLWYQAEQKERVYFITVVSIFGVYIAIVYSLSAIFIDGGSNFPYPPDSIIYDLDGGKNFSRDAQFNFASVTVKKLFYPLVNLPLSLSAHALGRILFFIPASYLYLVQVFHMGLMAGSAILLARMCKITGFSRIYFLLLYTFSYPFLVFSTQLERYVLPTFCIILFMYVCIYIPQVKRIVAMAASGTLMTSLVVFPFVAYSKDIKTWFLNLLKICSVFITVCIFCGTLSLIFGSIQFILDELDKYAGGGVSTTQKALQFINFISSIFVRPETILAYRVSLDENFEYITYALAPVVSVSWLGIVLITLSVAGFVINRKHQFVRMSFLWAIFTVIVVFVIGWYTNGNSAFLGTLYFGWAFFVLVFMFFEKLLEKQRIVKYAVYSLAFIAMTTLNIAGIADLIKFVVQYYPAR